MLNKGIIYRSKLYLFLVIINLLISPISGFSCDKSTINFVGNVVYDGVGTYTYTVEICLGISPNFGETGDITLDADVPILNSGFTPSVSTTYNYCSTTLLYNGQACSGNNSVGGTVINTTVVASGSVGGGNLSYDPGGGSDPLGPDDLVSDCRDCGNGGSICFTVTFQTASELSTIQLVGVEGNNTTVCPDEIVTAIPPVIVLCAPAITPLATASSVDTWVCAGGSTTLIGGATGGGTGTYSYDWSPANTLDNSSIPNPVASPNNTTNYTLVVTDNGCPSLPVTVVVTVPNQPEIEFNTPEIFVCDPSDVVSIPVTFRNGVPPYTFSYSDGTTVFGPIVTSDNPYMLDVSPGTNITYSATDVTDSDGCTGVTIGSTTLTYTDLNVVVGADFNNDGLPNSLGGIVSGGIVDFTLDSLPVLGSSTPNVAIPDATGGGGGGPGVTAPDCITISGINQTTVVAENINEICFTVSHARPGDLACELEAPGGAVFSFNNINDGLNCFPYLDMVGFMTGETANGQWCLTLIDETRNGQGGQVSGSFIDWSMDMNSIDTNFLPFTTIWDHSDYLTSGTDPLAIFEDPSGTYAACYELSVTDGAGCVQTDSVCIQSTVLLAPNDLVASLEKELNGVRVNWIYQGNDVIDNFFLEKGSNGIYMNEFAQLFPETGENSFSFLDDKVSSENSFYRVNAISRNGDLIRGNILNMNFSGNLNEFLFISKNPSQQLSVFCTLDTEISYSIISMQGKTLSKGSFENLGEPIAINSEGLAPGIYFVKYNSSEGSQGILKWVKH